MKTIVEALKDLYVALGGKEQDVANLVLNPDVIEKIAAVAGDAVKPELPALTGNAGKVLKVDADAEGVEWSEAGGGGGASCVSPVFTITGTEGNYQISCDKTYAELKAAYLSGLLVPGHVTSGDAVALPVEMSLYDEWTEGSDSGTYFSFVAYGPRYNINPTIPGNRLMEEIYIYYGEENGIPSLNLTRFSTYNIAITAVEG